jgi:hypothetical protein
MMDRSKAAQHNVLESRGVSQKGDGKGCNSRHALTKLRAVPMQRQRECHGRGGRVGEQLASSGLQPGRNCGYRRERALPGRSIRTQRTTG